mmetsp:Transcript_39481/g.84233  ORF Transcript_39481/g.84233 Transcript_39481/m.84233 type:complete len:81 (+) Transcript_39481:377-619(+)
MGPGQSHVLDAQPSGNGLRAQLPTLAKKSMNNLSTKTGNRGLSLREKMAALALAESSHPQEVCHPFFWMLPTAAHALDGI